MKSVITYFEADKPKRIPSKTERCLRAITQVAICWTLLASALMMYSMDAPPSSKLHFIACGALMISAGIYSLLFPLHFILREKPDVD